MSLASITSALAPTSMSRQGPCWITANGFISSRLCCAAASPQRRPERSPGAIICASSAPRSAEALRSMSLAVGSTIANDQTQAQPNETAVGAALAVLDCFMATLNAGDELALLATLHFPHYRLAGVRMRVWDQTSLEAILAIFSRAPARTGITVNGIFAKLSPTERPRCTWTCNSPAIALTIR